MRGNSVNRLNERIPHDYSDCEGKSITSMNEEGKFELRNTSFHRLNNSFNEGTAPPHLIDDNI